MKKFNQIIFFACGLLLTLPVFAQNTNQNQLNKKPLLDLTGFVNGKVAAEKVDLTKSFSIQLEGVLDKEGKLDPKKSKFTKSEGDAAMIEIGKDSIQAINDSGFFAYLAQMGIEKMQITLGQDDTRTYAAIVLDQVTAERSKTISSGLNTLIKMASTFDQNGMKKLDADTKFILSGVKVNRESKVVKINFDYEKSAVQEIISGKLKESEAKN